MNARRRLQGRKSLRMCWTRVLRVGWFDLVAEACRIILALRFCFDRLMTAGPRFS